MKKKSKIQDSVMDNRDKEPIIVDDDDEYNESLNSDVASSMGGKKRKLISKVWNYFEMLDTKPGEELMCKCKKCGAHYSAESKNGTGNLKRHLEKCVKMTTKDIGQFLLSSTQGSLLSRNPQFNQDKFRELLVYAMIRHDLPFSFVEYEGIRHVLKYLEPKVTFFGRQTARADVKKIHASLVSKIQNELSACPGRICLTSDGWSSIVTDGYISLTAHFVDSEWVLHKKILNFSYMPPPHNGVSLAEKIHTLVTCWGIDKKVFSLTLDNASANDSCVDILRSQLKLKDALVYDGVLFHIRCCAHILNLIVQEGLKKIDVAVEKVRESIKYVKGSQQRKISFRKCIGQTSLDDKKGLLQDVPTRWNSTYKMLSSALYYQLAFCQLQLSDSNFKSCPSSEEWKRIQTICSFLEIFDNATKAFSGSYYTTSNLYFPNVFRIQLKLVEACKSSDSFMKQIAEQMFVKFNKYWAKFNLVLAVAVIFDPRYKLHMLELAYNRLYGEESAELAKVKSTLFGIYDEYLEKEHGSSTTVATDVNNSKNVTRVNLESMDVWKEFETFDNIHTTSKKKKSELEMYLDEQRVDLSINVQVLDFWKAHAYRYPNLCRMARDVLSIPISTVASEACFSISGRIIDQYRSSLTPQIVESLMCSRDWLFGDSGLQTKEKEAMDTIIEDVISQYSRGHEDEMEYEE